MGQSKGERLTQLPECPPILSKSPFVRHSRTHTFSLSLAWQYAFNQAAKGKSNLNFQIISTKSND